jgi:hypothetical protein
MDAGWGSYHFAGGPAPPALNRGLFTLDPVSYVFDDGRQLESSLVAAAE